MSLPFDLDTIDYYDSNSARYIARTSNVDMSQLYEQFLEHVTPNGKILDAGCGGGRDANIFLKRGYKVVAFDASLEMVKATTKLTRQPAIQMRFDEIQFDNEFDAIWACASLLHVKRSQLYSILMQMGRALKSGGIIYLSSKDGSSERIDKKRFFQDVDREQLSMILNEQADLNTIKIWNSADTQRANNIRGWTNALCKKI